MFAGPWHDGAISGGELSPLAQRARQHSDSDYGRLPAGAAFLLRFTFYQTTPLQPSRQSQSP